MLHARTTYACLKIIAYFSNINGRAIHIKALNYPLPNFYIIKQPSIYLDGEKVFAAVVLKQVSTFDAVAFFCKTVSLSIRKLI